ncbi:hypothetical protein AWQ21_07460 [Picosynechococcus sp. PCC 7003]|uniref:HepT-like ribonuclease domain-containing protein n=1 Tax=Picosynechococcus sp. PCC 7003 TaxID=374981 RepID=UPI000810EBA5|nr:DUF86 domain-containing protein [Picosynechococcus sp. PCC 7003]ANV84232.1 hypothetical protein AWQ21_07460 [Picosynechococcus sp. PCC 7003]
MSRSLRLYLTDILKSITKIQNYAENLTYEELCEDSHTLDAIAHNLQIIGEATKQIPDSLREQYPQIEWRKVAGLRDIIAHTYFRVNTKIVWSIMTTKLNSLQTCVQLMLENDDIS